MPPAGGRTSRASRSSMPSAVSATSALCASRWLGPRTSELLSCRKSWSSSVCSSSTPVCSCDSSVCRLLRTSDPHAEPPPTAAESLGNAPAGRSAPPLGRALPGRTASPSPSSPRSAASATAALPPVTPSVPRPTALRGGCAAGARLAGSVPR
ncbi:hypothetical protein T492DRAFT_1043340 [Pavlovales sp. CCMP2436]|nr:hypothetical protein T492DRAFT_1043340 [Pavlovales sp. CCMP2436]